MTSGLVPGLRHLLRYRVPHGKVVACLYPEAPEFQVMPAVFATGYLVGLVEWACMQAIHPLLKDGPQTLGTHVDLSHAAPTVPGEELLVRVQLREVAGRRLVFDVAVEGVQGECVSIGTHERIVIDRARFEDRLARRRQPMKGAPAPAYAAAAGSESRGTS